MHCGIEHNPPVYYWQFVWELPNVRYTVRSVVVPRCSWSPSWVQSVNRQRDV